MDGFETTRRLRALGSKALIIAFTASVMPDAEQEARAAGADDFLRKPYQEAELLTKIARALDLPHEVEAPSQREDTPAAPLSTLVGQLPAELVQQLREAVLQARKERIERLAEQAARYSEPAARQIQALARQFQYEQLMSALEPS
jgi:CheY-like chemotaxis protein